MQKERKEWWAAIVYNDKLILVYHLMNELEFYNFNIINQILKKYSTAGFKTWQTDLSNEASLYYNVEFKPGNCYEYLAKSILDKSFPNKFDLDVLNKDKRFIILNSDLTVFKNKNASSLLQSNFTTGGPKIDPELKKQGQWLSGLKKYEDSPRDPNCPFKWL